MKILTVTPLERRPSPNSSTQSDSMQCKDDSACINGFRDRMDVAPAGPHPAVRGVRFGTARPGIADYGLAHGSTKGAGLSLSITLPQQMDRH